MSDATIPPINCPSWPSTPVCSPASATVSRSQPRPYPVYCPEASRCDVWSNWTVAGCSSLPLLIAIPKRTRSDGVDRNALDPAKQE
jgi:hypothetical protein